MPQIIVESIKAFQQLRPNEIFAGLSIMAMLLMVSNLFTWLTMRNRMNEHRQNSEIRSRSQLQEMGRLRGEVASLNATIVLLAQQTAPAHGRNIEDILRRAELENKIDTLEGLLHLKQTSEVVGVVGKIISTVRQQPEKIASALTRRS